MGLSLELELEGLRDVCGNSFQYLDKVAVITVLLSDLQTASGGAECRLSNTDGKVVVMGTL